MVNNKYITIRNLATFIVLGNILYWVFPFRPIVWRVAMVVLSLLVILSQKEKKLPLENIILVFAFFNLLHFIVSYLWISPNMSIIGNVLYAMLPLSMFVWLSQKGVMTQRYFSVLSLLLIMAFIPHYFHTREVYIERLDVVNEEAGLTNNATGLFLYLIPMLFLLKNRAQRWLLLLVCLFFIILGVKRGNIIAAIIPVLLFVHSEFKNSRRSIVKDIFVFLSLVITIFLVYKWVSSSGFFWYRWEETMEGDSSGRDFLYAKCWDLWSKSNSIITYLFGFGFDSTLLRVGKYAHNDWLEILMNYGLVGIVLYLLVFVLFVSQIRKTKDNTSKAVLRSVLFIWLFKTLYSMGYTEEDFIIMMISVGSVLGKYKQYLAQKGLSVSKLRGEAILQ